MSSKSHDPPDAVSPAIARSRSIVIWLSSKTSSGTFLRNLSAVRAAFLSTIRAECPAVLDDLWDEDFAPLADRMPPTETVALLTRRDPRPDDLPRGSVHREVRASIAHWARRWHVNAPWMRDQAWRTVRFWAAYPGSVGGRPPRWAPLIDTRAASRRPTDHNIFADSPTPIGYIKAVIFSWA